MLEKAPPVSLRRGSPLKFNRNSKTITTMNFSGKGTTFSGYFLAYPKNQM